jgi:two-component system, OmpR family, phosphate regulon sensor histidine kinase PhoR
MAARLRTHHKLFLSYSVLVAAVVVALVIGVDAALRQPLLERARADLLRELALARAIYDAAAAPTHADTLARRIAGLVERRVTVIAMDGTVLGDSGVPPDMVAHLEDHSLRAEFMEALAHGTGTTVRRSASVQQDLLYAASLTERGELIRIAMDLGQIDEAVGRVRRQIVEVGAIALLLAMGLSAAVSLAATRRLRRIRAAAVAMARGDLGVRIRPRQGDELDDLGASLDALAEELQRRMSQLNAERQEMSALVDAMDEGVLAIAADGSLRRANPAARRMFGLATANAGTPPEAIARRKPFLDIVRRVLGGEPVPATELTHDGRHLLATAQPLPGGGAVLVFLDASELRRLEGVRRDFVANASHELKTPLTAIRGYSETLLDDDLPADLRRKFIRTVHAHATRLQGILDDLLDLSRIESGGWSPDPTSMGIEGVAREAWQGVAEAAAARDLALDFVIAPDADRVAADPAGLRQIFSNLFSNAVRYTPPGGRITVASTAEGPDRVRVEVRDTGVGIPPEHLDRVFERFYRVDPARSREEGGTGLGLSIVRHLVERHDGRVEAESEVGRGTTIRFTLPAD